MDPDSCLEEIRLLISEITSGLQRHTHEEDELADLLKEKLENLDAWLSHGGFLPKAWSKAFERKE